MKERLLKALFVSITVALGITLVTILQNEDFSFVKSGLYAIVAFIVDFIFSYIFEKKKRWILSIVRNREFQASVESESTHEFEFDGGYVHEYIWKTFKK